MTKRSAMPLRKLHALSAVVIIVFLGLHMANHLAGLTGVAAHIAFMRAARYAYRTPVIEAALLSAFVLQLASGLALAVRGWKQRHGLVAWLQAGSGAYLALFLVVHVGSILFGRAVLNLDTNFYFAAAGLHVAPFGFFFAPYYFFGVAALFTHLACAAYWLAQGRSKLARFFVLAIPIATGAVMSLLVVLSLAGALYPVDIPTRYRATYAL
jgi:hypothetical protein